MRVLVFVDYYTPGFKGGGPIRSIANLVDHMGDNIDFDIVTRDRDLGDTQAFPNLDINIWHSLGKGRVRYLAPDQQNIATFRQIMNQSTYDWIYLNSFFSPFCGLWPLVARLSMGRDKARLLMAPRGELAKSALSLKPIKKLIYRRLGRVLGLWADANWHASTSFEAADIKTGLGVRAAKILMARDLMPLSTKKMATKKYEGVTTRQPNAPLKVVFLSRISPMKNLLFALDVLTDVKVPVEFSIYGPIGDADYWQACEKKITLLPLHIKVDVRGPVHVDDVIETLSQYDLFFLPTLGENFGHVIGEALLAGLPLLITDQTPWRDLESRGIGLDLALTDKTAFARYIEQLGRASKTEWDMLSECIRKEVAQLSDQSQLIAQNRALFFDGAANFTSSFEVTE